MNWDKPLTWKEFDKLPWSGVFKYHGIMNGSCYAKSHNLIDENGDEACYELYINYCKIMSSPLGQALL